MGFILEIFFQVFFDELEDVVFYKKLLDVLTEDGVISQKIKDIIVNQFFQNKLG
jgi:hypothetical protein